MVLLDTARGEALAELWAQGGRNAGIWCRVRNVGFTAGGDLITPGGTGPYGYEYEVWVRPKDEERARRVLGL
ncbi:MAG TPA: hypothetical protein VFT91_01300 [Dehalococcoidia bacterium]|nr:hypothetical protein [Dehalococcoidia bacterium]